MTARKRNKRANDLHARDYVAASRNPQTIAGIHRKLEVGGSISKHEGLVLFARIADLEGQLASAEMEAEERDEYDQ